MLQNSNFRRTRGHWLFPKNGSYGYSAKSQWGPLGSIFGPIGSHWVKKMDQNLKKLPSPKIRIFDYSAVINFSQKKQFTVMAPNHSAALIGSILGPMGSNWVKKNGAKNSNFRLTRSHRFFAINGIYGHANKTWWGHLRVHLGADGVPLGPKNGSKRRKLPCPKIRIFDFPAVIDFTKKNESYGYGAKSRWGPPRVHLGANGVPLGTKNGSKP